MLDYTLHITIKAGKAWTATKVLNLRFRGNSPTDFAAGLDWAEYRLIANYNF